MTSWLQFQKKGVHLNTVECFYIHKEAASNSHLNDEHTICPNRVFDTILNMLSKQQNPHSLPLLQSLLPPSFLNTRTQSFAEHSSTSTYTALCLRWNKPRTKVYVKIKDIKFYGLPA